MIVYFNFDIFNRKRIELEEKKQRKGERSPIPIDMKDIR